MSKRTSENSGILLVNKPSGPTSHDIVDRARILLGTRDVGHTGTLDPIASGLLILTVGLANKLSNYLMDGEKGYRVKVRLGRETTTLDREGEVISEKNVDLTLEDIQTAVWKLVGDLNLKVPSFSAVKVDGQKLYKLARQDKAVPVVERVMTFHKAELQERTDSELDILLVCAKGAYVRSWVHELGVLLGCGAMVQELQRVQNAPYDLAQSLEIDDANLKLIPFEKILSNWPRVEAFENEMQDMSYGHAGPALTLRAQKALKALPTPSAGVFVTAPNSTEIICFFETQKDQQTLKLKKVFVAS